MKNQQQDQPVGSVKSIYRYPVKSFAGEQIESTHLGWHGVAGDRRWAFVRTGNLSGFPWLTPRKLPRMILYKAYFADPADLESQVIVKTPDGDDFPIDSDLLIQHINDAYGREPVHLIHSFSGLFDAMDVSIITPRSIRSIEEEISCELGVRRFRPNIVIDAFADRKFPEEKWIGDLLVFGERNDSARLRINRKDLRCVVANLDPDTAEQNPAIMQAIVALRKNYLGAYGSTERPGTIEVGDPVFVV